MIDCSDTGAHGDGDERPGMAPLRQSRPMLRRYMMRLLVVLIMMVIGALIGGPVGAVAGVVIGVLLILNDIAAKRDAG